MMKVSGIKKTIIPTTLIDSLREHKAYLLIGSGVSIPLGYPSWGQLIEKLYNKYAETECDSDL